MFIAFVACIILFIYNYVRYSSSSYAHTTDNSYLSALFNKGIRGEYLTYDELRKYERIGCRFIYNLYLPKSNQQTTEIDLIMISPVGIFVFESKNYSGWIFGRENQSTWCQVLPTGRGSSQKEHFYNPVQQNRGHIKHLKSTLQYEVPMWSIITFSNRCTLKKIELSSHDVSVINRRRVTSVVADIFKINKPTLSQEQINEIYNALFPFSQVDNNTKSQHISDIKSYPETHNTTPKKQPQTIKETPKQTKTDSSPEEFLFSDLFAKPSPKLPTSKPPKKEPEILICPQCGGRLVVRTAKRGPCPGKEFYGCSNYPNCHYIQNFIN